MSHFNECGLFIFWGKVDSASFQLVHPFDGDGVSARREGHQVSFAIGSDGGHFLIHGGNPIRILGIVPIRNWFIESNNISVELVLEGDLSLQI